MSFLKILIFSYLIILITSPPTTEVPKKEEVKNKGNYKSEEEEIKQMSDSFSTEWEKGMIDYDSDYVYLIPIAYKTNEVYYETISKVPARLRGAFILDENEDKKIELRIIGPDNKKVYSQASHMGIFDFNVTKVGRYKIELHNKFINSEVKVTFTMSTGQNVVLKKDDLSQTEKNLEKLLQFIKRFNVEYKVSKNLHFIRFAKINKTNRYLYTFSIIETIILIIVSLWQFYYMKHLFEIKGSL
jgi:hypothetical protein